MGARWENVEALGSGSKPAAIMGGRPDHGRLGCSPTANRERLLMNRAGTIPDFEGGSRVWAILGPTNTGKTHRAIERMLSHGTGMIGLPLRLLAREVYERVSLRVGEQAVALITGEEKRVPPTARYWICTVESMPLDRAVSFLCVDEIQLAAHPERGHVFTDRILHARGVRETLFLGALTMAPMLERLLPGVTITQHPRFSKLQHEGSFRLTMLPPRSALVAFSAAQVYELAERLRERHGGAAIVLGALSPRTRNAQVAMYQAGEVQHLVATDAIGMGLNLDIDRVVFSTLRKYDGRNHRALETQELAQIAGRAGRFRNDGAFGTLRGADRMEPRQAEDIENHVFPPLRALKYRNSKLDFSSLDALRSSLAEPPPRAFLQPVEDAEDTDALERLAANPQIAERLGGEEALRLLWDVARIPDFHSNRSELRIRMQAAIFLKLRDPQGQLDDDFLARNVLRLERVDGDIETLTGRIADIRHWTYITHHARWIRSPKEWQERTREIEDRLSDALHASLTERFVDRASVALSRRSGEEAPQIEALGDGRVLGAGHLVGRMDAFTFVDEGMHGVNASARSRLMELLRPEVQRRVQGLVQDRFESFTLDPDGRVLWRGVPVARLEAGETTLSPSLKMLRHDLLGAGDRERVRRRLDAWTRDMIAELLAPLSTLNQTGLSPALRGLLYRLSERLGSVPTEEARQLAPVLTRDDRAFLASRRVGLGMHHVFSRPMLEEERMRLKEVLWRLQAGRPATLSAVGAFMAGLKPAESLSLRELGFWTVADLAVRVDRFEELSALIRERGRSARLEDVQPILAFLCDVLGSESPEAHLALILGALGWRRAGEGAWAREPVRTSRPPAPPGCAPRAAGRSRGR